MSEEKNLLEVSHLKQYFPVRQGFKTNTLKAVDDISFAIKPGETLGLVGESGCGKTTVGRTLLRLYQPTAGKITFDGNVLFDSGEQYDENDKEPVPDCDNGYCRLLGRGSAGFSRLQQFVVSVFRGYELESVVSVKNTRPGSFPSLRRFSRATAVGAKYQRAKISTA